MNYPDNPFFESDGPMAPIEPLSEASYWGISDDYPVFPPIDADCGSNDALLPPDGSETVIVDIAEQPEPNEYIDSEPTCLAPMMQPPSSSPTPPRPPEADATPPRPAQIEQPSVTTLNVDNERHYLAPSESPNPPDNIPPAPSADVPTPPFDNNPSEKSEGPCPDNPGPCQAEIVQPSKEDESKRQPDSHANDQSPGQPDGPSEVRVENADASGDILLATRQAVAVLETPTSFIVSGGAADCSGQPPDPDRLQLFGGPVETDRDPDAAVRMHLADTLGISPSACYRRAWDGVIETPTDSGQPVRRPVSVYRLVIANPDALSLRVTGSIVEIPRSPAGLEAHRNRLDEVAYETLRGVIENEAERQASVPDTNTPSDDTVHPGTPQGVFKELQTIGLGADEGVGWEDVIAVLQEARTWVKPTAEMPASFAEGRLRIFERPNGGRTEIDLPDGRMVAIPWHYDGNSSDPIIFRSIEIMEAGGLLYTLELKRQERLEQAAIRRGRLSAYGAIYSLYLGGGPFRGLRLQELLYIKGYHEEDMCSDLDLQLAASLLGCAVERKQIANLEGVSSYSPAIVPYPADHSPITSLIHKLSSGQL